MPIVPKLNIKILFKLHGCYGYHTRVHTKSKWYVENLKTIGKLPLQLKIEFISTVNVYNTFPTWTGDDFVLYYCHLLVHILAGFLKNPTLTRNVLVSSKNQPCNKLWNGTKWRLQVGNLFLNRAVVGGGGGWCNTRNFNQFIRLVVVYLVVVYSCVLLCTLVYSCVLLCTE